MKKEECSSKQMKKDFNNKKKMYKNDVKLSWIVSTLKIFLLKLIQTFITNAAFLVPLLIEFVKFVILALALFSQSQLIKQALYAKWYVALNLNECFINILLKICSKKQKFRQIFTLCLKRLRGRYRRKTKAKLNKSEL